jgi:starch-binding outer membrane protein, SusD/RagB family
MRFNKNITILALAMGLMVSSCEDVIDIKPTDSLVTDIALTNINDFKKALTGTYAATASASYWGGNMIVLNYQLSDNARKSVQNLGEGVQVHSFSYTAGLGEAASAWNAMYSVINRANIIINRIDAIEGTDAEKNQIKGEALALRAMAHFDLVRLFSQRYNYTADASHLGVPIMLESKISSPARNTVKEVYDQVTKDLTDAKTLLAGVVQGPTRITPLAVSALQAKVALYTENYTDAITYSTEALAGKPIASKTEFATMWRQANGNAEAIFKIALPQGAANIGGNFYSVTNDLVSFNPTQDLLDEYGATAEEKAKDVRYTSYYEIIPTRAEPNIVFKYIDKNAAIKGQSDVIILRSADMLLIRAEAYARTNQGDKALADLNTLRAARITGFTPDPETGVGQETGTDLLNAIFTERRKELAFEGDRFFDLKRRNEAIVRGADCNSTSCTLPADDLRFAFPIPQTEVYANPNIEQNEAYK